MKHKLKERELALNLRRKGLSYSEILSQVPVAKSSLSLWLKSVGLAKAQKQRLTEKKLISARRGAEARRQQRLTITKEIKEKAKKEIDGSISLRELWLMGIMLYWAEGSKEKEYDQGVPVVFSNSDPFMIKVFLKWVKFCLQIPDIQIDFDIYIHDNHVDKTAEVGQYWSEITGFPRLNFDKIYFKKHIPKTIRKNTGNSYHGLLRIKIKSSTNLNRKISGWIEGICLNCGVV